MARTLLGEALSPEQRRQRAIQIARQIESAVNSRTEATVAAVTGDLNRLRIEIIGLLAQQPPSWQVTQLNALLAEVKAAVDRWKAGAASRVGQGTLANADEGAALPGAIAIAVGNEDVGMIASEYAQPSIDDTVVEVAYASSAYMVEDIGGTLQVQVDSLIRRMALAGMTPYDAIQSLTPSATVRRGMPFASAAQRAETIIRTEMGRVFSQATDAAMQDASDYLPGLRQQWIATDDDRTRPSHRDAHEQIVDMGEPFDVGGASLRFPRDPDGPPEETINCRCVVVPWIDEWEVQQGLEDRLAAEGLALPAMPAGDGETWGIDVPYEVPDVASLTPEADMGNVRKSITSLVSALQSTRFKDAVDPLGDVKDKASTVKKDKDQGRSLGFLRHALESDGTPEGRRKAAEAWLKQELAYQQSIGNDSVRVLQILRNESKYLDVGIQAARLTANNLLQELLPQAGTSAGGSAGGNFASVLRLDGKPKGSQSKFYGITDKEWAASDPNVRGAVSVAYSRIADKEDPVVSVAIEDRVRRAKLIEELARKAGVDPYGGSLVPISGGAESGQAGTDWLRFLSTLPDEALLGVSVVEDGQTLQYGGSDKNQRVERMTLMPVWVGGGTSQEYELITVDEWRKQMRAAADGIDALRTLRSEASAVAHVAWAKQASEGVINVGVRSESPVAVGGITTREPTTKTLGAFRKGKELEKATDVEKALTTIERIILRDGRIMPTTWAGKAEVADLANAAGEHDWDGKISISTDTWATLNAPGAEGARTAAKTLIHEMVHGSRSTASDQEFVQALGIEEGLTELRSQIIAAPLIAQHVESKFASGKPTKDPLAKAFGVIAPETAPKTMTNVLIPAIQKVSLTGGPAEGWTEQQWKVVSEDAAGSVARDLEYILRGGRRTQDDINWGNFASVGTSAPSYTAAMKEWLGDILGSERWLESGDRAAVFGKRAADQLRDLVRIVEGKDPISGGGSGVAAPRYTTGKEMEFWLRDAIDHGVKSSKSVSVESKLAMDLPPLPGETLATPKPVVGSAAWYERTLQASQQTQVAGEGETEPKVSPYAKWALRRSVEEEAKAIRYHIVRRAATEMLSTGGIAPETVLAYELLEKGALDASKEIDVANYKTEDGRDVAVDPKDVSKRIAAKWGWDRTGGETEETAPGGGWAQRQAESLIEAGRAKWGEYAVGNAPSDAMSRVLRDREAFPQIAARELLAETYTSIAYPLHMGMGSGGVIGLPKIADRPQFKHALRMTFERFHPTGENTYQVRQDGSLTMAMWETRALRNWADGIEAISQPDTQKAITATLNQAAAVRTLDGPARIDRSSYGYHRAMLLQVWAMGKRMGMIDVSFPDWISETRSGITSYSERVEQINLITREAMGIEKKPKVAGDVGAGIMDVARSIDKSGSSWVDSPIIDPKAHAEYQKVLRPLLELQERALAAGVDPSVIAFHSPVDLGKPVTTKGKQGMSPGVDAKGKPVIPVLKGKSLAPDKMDWYWWQDQDLRPVSTWKQVVTDNKIDNLRVYTIGGRQFQIGGNLNWLPLGMAQDRMTFRDKYGRFLIGPWDLLDYNEETWKSEALADEVERRRAILQNLIDQRTEGSK